MCFKQLLLIMGCCFGLTQGSIAQQAPTPVPTPPLPFNKTILPADDPRAAAEDTVHALTTLFSRRRTGGISWISGSLLGGLRVITAASRSKSIPSAYGPIVVQEGIDGGGVAAVIGTMLLFDAYGVSKLVRFSAAKQADLIAAVRLGQPLPAAVRHRLKPRFFKQRVLEYKPMKYKAASTI